MDKFVITHKHECHWDGVLKVEGNKNKLRFTFGKNYYREWETSKFDQERQEILFWLENSTSFYYAEKTLDKVTYKISKLCK